MVIIVFDIGMFVMYEYTSHIVYLTSKFVYITIPDRK